MKVAVTATGPTLDSVVDPRFGRCPFFVIVETDEVTFEAIENPNLALTGGAGIQSAQLIARKGATAVLTGSCGPNAHATLSAAGVALYVDVSGTVAEAVERYGSGQLQTSPGPNAASHAGLGDQPGGDLGRVRMRAGGMGAGRGMGGGRGRGMGGGGGRGMGGGGRRGMGRG
jgi:predicted Fe-Mo cluster-binding NifX family protein